MNAPAAEITEFKAPDFACIRIVGRANFTCAPGFKQSMDDLIGNLPARLIIDVSECQLMDSTFLGVLSEGAERYHLEMFKNGFIELLNPNERISALIEGLGVEKWFHKTSGRFELPAGVRAKRVPLLNTTRIELKETSFFAHESLSQVSESNRLRFAELTRTLRSDLENLRAGEPPPLPGFDMAAINRQAGDLGGDFYDFAPLSGLRVAVIIADVCGKGTSAAQVAAQCRPFLRDALSRDRLPAAMFHDALSLVPMLPENMFLTALCVMINAASHSFRVARAGHEPLLWYHAQTSKVELLQPKGMALGIERMDLDDATFVEREFSINSGDILLLHTDGITESISPTDEEFGCERLKSLLAESAGLDAKAIAAKIFSVVGEFTNNAPAEDDRTIVVIKAL